VSVERRRSIYLDGVRVDLTTRTGVTVRVPGSELARCVQRGLRASAAPEPASVTVVLTDDEELADLNREHMGVDGPTDVLSFPMLPPEAFLRKRVGDPGPRSRKESRLVARERTHIGDIAISVERAVEQAEQGRGGQTGDVRWSAADELRLLVTHGTLHLCGWDHAEPGEEAEMRSLEQRLLA
jgi:probable rRNA maturation factor